MTTLVTGGAGNPRSSGPDPAQQAKLDSKSPSGRKFTARLMPSFERAPIRSSPSEKGPAEKAAGLFRFGGLACGVKLRNFPIVATTCHHASQTDCSHSDLASSSLALSLKRTETRQR